MAAVIPSSKPSQQFNKAYYDRFYRNPDTRAATPASAARQAAFITAYLRYLEIDIRHILDVGCGTGMLLRAFGRQYPKARSSGIEYSSYLCEKYGWTEGSVAQLPDVSADLVICNDVLGYLEDADCARALKNLARVSKRAMYLGVLTAEDLDGIDAARTDSDQLVRPARWYRQRLKKHFVNAGGGLWLKRPVEVTLWSLEHLE